MQIKIRAWDTQLKTFIYSGYGSKTFSIFAKKTNCPRFIKNLFTGLKDKNGKEIYEGDIIDFWFEEHFNQGNQKGEIVFKEFEGAYYIDCGSVSIAVNSLDIDYSQFEVVENIYQNPESLEAKSA